MEQKNNQGQNNNNQSINNDVREASNQNTLNSTNNINSNDYNTNYNPNYNYTSYSQTGYQGNNSNDYNTSAYNTSPYNSSNYYGNQYNGNQYNEKVNASYGVNDVNSVKKSNAKKIIACIAAGLVLTVGGGAIGGISTYGIMKNTSSSNKSNQVSSTDYAAPQFTSSTDGSLSVSEAFQKVAPAVVTITTKSLQKSQYGLFAQEVDGVGSGFIINNDGYILTNYHVIADAKQVKVLLSTGKEVDAKVINYDQARDMAVVKLAEGTEIPGVAELGNSDALYPGEDVIAIGTPLSTEFAQTCTKGIISAVSRTVTTESGTEMKAIQTDTAINPGNSGGPLINTKGQVIGINSMKLAETTVEGIGFAIPINEASERIDSLSKPILSLGVSIQEITSDKSKQTGYPEGVYVAGVEQDSSAEKAGIEIGDVIKKFDGKEIKTASDLLDAKAEKNAGDKVEVIVSRDNKNIKLELQLEESNKN